MGEGNEECTSSSCFQKTVCLYDWWLIKTQSQNQNQNDTLTLGVAGSTSTGQRPMREFSSAPIVKRYDPFTLDTADGVCIQIKGLINQRRASLNGFPPHVSRNFVFGFPSHWEQYAQHFTATPTAGDGSSPTSTGHQFQEPLDANRSIKPGGESLSKTPNSSRGLVKTKAAQEFDAKEETKSMKKTKRKIVFDTQVTPQASGEKVKVSIVSPECLSYGRSRSGRLLLPVMEFWRNQMPVYDVDRKIIGIQENIPVLVSSRGSRSETQKKQRR